MKLLFVTEYFPTSKDGEITGGVEARCFYMTKELSKKHDIKVVCSWRKGLPRKQRIGSVLVERVGVNHEYSNKGGFISRLRFSIAAYKAVCKSEGYDVVDGFAFSSYLPAYYGAQKIGAKAICTYHETWIGDWVKNKGLMTGIVGEILERMSAYKNWDLIIPVSNFTKKELVKRRIKRPMEVVYNGVILDDFKNLKVAKAKEFRIVCVSRLVKTKRQETLLNAVKHLNDKSIRTVLVGSGDDEKYFRQKVIEMDLSKQVRMTGFLKTKEEVIAEIKAASVLVHPSAVEGFGITVVEGMAAGLPVVVSDIPPLREVVGEGKYGMVFKLDDYKELAKCIKTLKENKKKYLEMIKLSEKRAKDFEWKNVCKKYVKVISF